MEKQIILNTRHFELTLNRLCYELIESHNDFSNTVLIGLQPRGINVVARLKKQLETILFDEKKNLLIQVPKNNIALTKYVQDTFKHYNDSTKKH